MKTTDKPTVTDSPKEQGDKGSTSHPKDPNNDPDQTPVKETQDPPTSNPKKDQPSTEKQKVGFKYNNENK